MKYCHSSLFFSGDSSCPCRSSLGTETLHMYSPVAQNRLTKLFSVLFFFILANMGKVVKITLKQDMAMGSPTSQSDAT